MNGTEILCPVSIINNGKKLSPDDLIRLSNVSPLSLSFVNEFGQSKDIIFTRNELIELPNTKANSSCFFNGLSEDLLSAVNLCDSAVSGIISTRRNYFAIEIRDNQIFLVPQSRLSCDFGSRSKRKDVVSQPEYYSKLVEEKFRFLELALVFDNSMYKKYGEDEKKVTERAQALTNIVNALYYPLKVKVSLIYVEIWKDNDIVDVAVAADRTLEQFLVYRQKMLTEHPHDNAHMLTNIRFEQGVLGKAYKGTMCSFDYSGGVDVDHSDNAASVAATLAHEIGHNFGMDHDINDACACPQNQCIMAPSLGYVPPTFWSECSVDAIVNSFERGMDVCLENVPEKTISSAKCGNGIVEGNEECDCGAKKCNNKCCDGATCRLTEGAECAEGVCCDLNECKPRSRATVCRAANDICDLPEFCNGRTSDCPADFFVQDGHICPEREGEFCMRGKCGSKNDQCKTIWGQEAKAAVPQCYDLNRQNHFGGNCGFDFHTRNFTSCAPEDTPCGRLHCETQAERPIIGTPQTVQHAYSNIRYGKEHKACYVIKTTYSSGKKKERDHGMVLDGAQCGTDKICVDTKCRLRKDVNKTVSLCTDDCNWRGICNNVGNCHCEKGFGGIACEIPGYGGSVNSNTAYVHRGVTPSTVFLGLSAIVFFAFIVACIFAKVKKNRNLLSEFWEWTKQTLHMHGTLEPVRRAPSPPRGKTKRLSFRRNETPAYETRVTYSRNLEMNSAQPGAQVYISAPVVGGYSNIPHQYPPAPPAVVSPKINRTPSARPSVPPPSVPLRPKTDVITKLYEEKGEELGLIEQTASAGATHNKPLPRTPDEVDDYELKYPVNSNDNKQAPPPLPPKPPKSKR